MGSASLSSEELKLQGIPCTKDTASEIKHKKKEELEPGAFDALRRRIVHESRDIIVSVIVVSALLALYGLSGVHGLWVRLAGNFF
ncbi:MAG: hypothetical protein JSU90_01845 [Nitrospiraceae bacterium]|nr:MAG: hypothetical protein JSU90_01845 [Nitrospiraceae bacterium]